MTKSMQRNETCSNIWKHVGLQTDLSITRSWNCTCKCNCNSASIDYSACHCHSEPCVCNQIAQCATTNNSEDSVSCGYDSPVRKPSTCSCATSKSSSSADTKTCDNCVGDLAKTDKLQRQLDETKQLYKEKVVAVQKTLTDAEQNLKSEMENLKSKHQKELEKLTAQLKTNETTKDYKDSNVCRGKHRITFARCSSQK